MKQHYLPQFYLDNFVDAESPPGHAPYLWVFSKKTGAWRRRAPKNLAIKADFYTFYEKNQEKRQELEQALSILDGKTASIFREKISLQKPLDRGERGIVAEFLGRMLLLVRSFRQSVDAFLCDSFSQQMAMLATNPALFEEFRNGHLKPLDDEISRGLKPEDIHPKHWKIGVNQNYSLSLILAELSRVKAKVARMSWTFLVSGRDAPFVTGDSPFSMIDPGRLDSSIGHGLANPEIEVSFPVSSGFTLLATWKTGLPDYVPVRSKTVAKLNRRQVSFARDFVVACKPTFPGDDALSSVDHTSSGGRSSRGTG